ncbi:hypothetical protein [Saccharothrix lopnurensis]|uniref:L,D-transpeptidase-like protein n=1 Tax=Saccharothrix lopnurensis TaxID=1670621 RepID=A0ABW1PA04_9PSEU
MTGSDTSVPEDTATEQARPMPAPTAGGPHDQRPRRRTRIDGTLRVVAQGLGLIAVTTLVVTVLLLREDNTVGPRAGRTVTASTTVTVTATPSTPEPVPAEVAPAAVTPQPVSSEQLAALPAAVVGAASGQAITDPAPGSEPGTTVLHPTRDTAVYAEPGGLPVAVLPPYQLLSPTWVPVVARRPGWALVLLPTRPHADGTAAAGWIHLQPEVRLADTDRRIEIDTTTGTIVVLAELGRTGTIPTAAHATAAHATAAHADATRADAPGRRSFVAIGNRTLRANWLLRLMWPVAVDPARLCSGPLGGVSMPGLPARSGLGAADGTGCVTTPDAVRDALGEVPTGTVVLLR